MALVLAVALGAYVLGRLAGGTLPRLATVPVRGVRLLLVALLLHAVGGVLAGWLPSAYRVGVGCSAIFVVVFALRNRRLVGVPLIGIGLFANLLVVAANGAMPVSAEAAARAGVHDAGDVPADDQRREPLTDATQLAALADRVPVALPPHPEVASLGDVLVAAGIGLFVTAGMNTPRRRGGSRPGDRRPDALGEEPRPRHARMGA